MNRTFLDGRKLILDGSTVDTIKETYLLVLGEKEMAREFQRLTEMSLFSEFDKGLDKYADRLILYTARGRINLIKTGHFLEYDL